MKLTRLFILACLGGCWMQLLAQDVPALPDARDLQRNKFNQVFFEAIREKTLENMDEAFRLFQEARNLDPNNDVVCYELGLMYFNRGEPFMAEALLKKAVLLAPGNVFYLETLVQVYERMGKYREEAETWKRLYALEPENFEYGLEIANAYVRAGMAKEALKMSAELEADYGLTRELVEVNKAIYLREGKVKKAAKDLERLIAADPQADHFRMLYQLYKANEMDKKALEVNRRLLKRYPEDPRANLEMAEYHRVRNEMKQSFAYLQHAIAAPELPIDPKIQVLVSLYQITEQDRSLLETAYHLALAVINAHPRDPKGFAMLGDYLVRDEKYREARDAYRTAVQLPNGAKANLWNQILLISSELNEQEVLLKDATEAADLFPTQPLPWLLKGFVLVQQKEWKPAIEALESGLPYAIGNRGLLNQYHTFLAEAHHHLGAYQESDLYFEKILLDNPSDAGTLNNYAYYLSVRRERLDKALRMTIKSNELEPDNPVFLDTWAWVLFRKGDFAAALEKMERVMALGGGDSGEVLEHYGDILFHNNRVDEAVKQWRKAKEKGDASAMIDQKISQRQYVE
jgi:tetratricopeptide (TPR) repeat protein